MSPVELRPHPAHPPRCVARCVVSWSFAPGWLRLRYRVEHDGGLVIPPFAGKGRADGLWRTTCFELFLRGSEGRGYSEFNLSPSERWAAYDFTAPREGMRERPMPRDPVCTIRQGRGLAIFDAALPFAGLPALPARMGLSAVLEEAEGAITYWAIDHAREKPDFHDPACFTAELAPPRAT